MQDWIDYITRKYGELYYPNVKLFKLDKTQTELDSIYNEETKARIYLNPTDIRMMYNDNPFINMLGLNLATEEEQPMEFYCNFNYMVQKLTDLKTSHIADMYITYNGTGIPAAKKYNNIFTLYINNEIYVKYDLTDKRYSTVRELATYINSFNDWTVIIEGHNDGSINLINTSKTVFPASTFLIYTEDESYKNITQVVEMGDVVLTDKNRLYEITSARPAGDFGWEYTTWAMQATLAKPDQMNLPGNYLELIKNNKYGFEKINME